MIYKSVGGLLRTLHKGVSILCDTPASASPQASNLGQLNTLEGPSLSSSFYLLNSSSLFTLPLPPRKLPAGFP